MEYRLAVTRKGKEFVVTSGTQEELDKLGAEGTVLVALSAETEDEAKKLAIKAYRDGGFA